MEDLVNYVRKSTYRYKIFMSIGENVKFPSEISSDSGIAINHISFILKQLLDMNLVEILNPEVKKGRLYRLTPKGLDVLARLK